MYLAGAGLITALQGATYIWGVPPAAYVFVQLGPVFLTIWGVVWFLVGLSATTVAFTGHRHPDWDRLAAFAVMMLWWISGFLYLLSAVLASDSGRQGSDLLIGLRFILTGIVLSAGVVQGLRKTHEIWLRQRAEERVRELEGTVLEIAAENASLRLRVEHREAE